MIMTKGHFFRSLFVQGYSWYNITGSGKDVIPDYKGNAHGIMVPIAAVVVSTERKLIIVMR